MCYIKVMRKVLSLLLLPFLISCSSKAKYSETCYQCFYGNEIELSIECDYDYLNGKHLLQNDLKDKNDDFYFDYYVLNNSEEVSAFLDNKDLRFKQSDVDTIKRSRELIQVVFIAQIPNEYKAFKRNNFQFRKSESEEIYLTSNFYTYGNRKDISYCFFFVIKDGKISEKYVYSFVIKIDKNFFEFDKTSSIRGILSDSAYKKEELPNLRHF